ncbi:MAG: SAM-dependent methyltransferase [Lachnospiraceae bacterium]|nr:SAM-dependent methyltransferase [Lachnospiraceae bacterium]
MKRPVLSKRMEAVMGLVPRNISVVCDVGCDHAYVPIRLITDGIADKVIAMDVRSGPLEIARSNIREYGLEEAIDTRLSDGLTKLLPMEAEAIVIAGMGGLLVKRILEEGSHILHSDKPPFLVLQPQSDIDKVRHFLYERSYHIVKEAMVFEDGKYYTVILAHPGEETPYALEEDFIYGRCNIENHDRVLLEYLKKEYSIYQGILARLDEALSTEDPESRDSVNMESKTEMRLDELKEQMKINRAAYERCIV